MHAELAFRSDNLLGEGIVWSSLHNRVMWTNILGRQFFIHDPATRETQSVSLNERLCCFAPQHGTELLAGFDDGLYAFDYQTGARRLRKTIETDLATTRLNDGKLDRQGRLIFGTMDEAPAGPNPIAHVWSYDGHHLRQLISGVKISNSICFSPDGRRMYFADTPNRRIDLFDYDPATGEIENRRLFAHVPDGGGWPDGSTVDAEGYLWNAEWDGSCVRRYDPDGKVERVITLPVPLVTCCAFGGESMTQLFITTARIGLDAKQVEARPLSGSLFVCETGIRGLSDTVFVDRA